MDTTEKNMMMCEKAEEIQNSWTPQKYDYAWKKYYRHRGITVIINRRQQEQIAQSKSHYVWLPTQDRLQEMAWNVEIGEDNIDHLLMRFYQLITSFPDTLHGVYNSSYWTQFRTMEQKWLAFVMKSRYNKVWNGKEWVKNE